MQPPPKMDSGPHSLPLAKHKKTAQPPPDSAKTFRDISFFLQFLRSPHPPHPLLLEGELPYFADKIIPAEIECACT